MKAMTVRLHQRGAATLVVVMVLFFIMAMMAAYANRNLIFEQRIASNYYRSGVALEAADAGSEWALGRLNGLNVNDSCTAAGSPTQSFRQRYLGVAPASRQLTPLKIGTSASCVRVAGLQGWTCQCPVSGWSDATIAAAAQMQPSFAIEFQPAGRAGVVRVISRGCTGSQTTVCKDDQAATSLQMLATATVRVEAALVSALKMPPAQPLTIRQTVTDGVGALGLHNTDPRSSGLLLQTGGAAPVLADGRLDSLPGTPVQQALLSNDGLLATMEPDAMFASFFGMAPGQYRDQPAMRIRQCDGDCMEMLKAAYNQGVRMVWIDGPLNLSSNDVLGSDIGPLLIVADGNVTINGPMVLNGLLYARGDIVWNNPPGGQLGLLNGALIGERTLQVSGRVDLWYRGAIIDALSNATGSFVRVPGSWWDAGGG
jgi:Tfp pilus assembly protein PilX